MWHSILEIIHQNWLLLHWQFILIACECFLERCALEICEPEIKISIRAKSKNAAFSLRN